ncbi:MAG TPA: L-aspartate oxidase [Candidatus Dormibacteraeota bacterium]|nr:L-aspartate oxidase [Candidatus Dormibacteraeota bacterium]
MEGPYDCVVVGGGIAGLTAALTVSARARVALVAKGPVDDGATRWAQGGIAAAVADDDSAQLHFDDTVAAGRGLCDEDAVRVLVAEGPQRVRELADWGAGFDSDRDRMLVGREAAHSRNRIVHAGGDATGREVEAALVRTLRQSGATVIENIHVTSLLVDDNGRCAGVELRNSDGTGAPRVLGAGAVILASGGAGQLWRNTTNPAAATGDGVALAWDAGAEVASMEFMQFHPTALALDGAPRFLISEAMRGEGAHVVDAAGDRFLFDADPRGELAGRDVVSQAIWQRLLRDGGDHVYLDCRPLGAAVRTRFPTITATCRAHGIDITTAPIPIAPAAHYMIGGVRTDVDGATSLAGLFACGEVASTGVHGANRLASNSLLEGLVFGHRAAVAALHDIAERPVAPPRRRAADEPSPRPASGDSAAGAHLRDAMWEGCGLVRDATGLRTARDAVEEIAVTIPGHGSLDAVRLHQSTTTAALVCRAALLREESRGAHTRADFPSTRDSWHGVLVMQKQRGHRFDRNP